MPYRPLASAKRIGVVLTLALELACYRSLNEHCCCSIGYWPAQSALVPRRRCSAFVDALVLGRIFRQLLRPKRSDTPAARCLPCLLRGEGSTTDPAP